jgi:hypothetical protein
MIVISGMLAFCFFFASRYASNFCSDFSLRIGSDIRLTCVRLFQYFRLHWALQNLRFCETVVNCFPQIGHVTSRISNFIAITSIITCTKQGLYPAMRAQMIVISSQPSLGCLSRLWVSFHAIKRSKDFRFRSGSANRLATETLFQNRLRHWALQNLRLSDSVVNRFKHIGQVTSLTFHFIAITNNTCQDMLQGYAI